MRRARADGRSRGEGRHIRLHHYMLRSAAWSDLSANARALYVQVAARYNGSNNGRVPYSLRDAATELRIGKATAMRAFAELVEHGFLAVVRKGQFDRKQSHATEWRLSEFMCDVTRAVAAKDFMRWRPEGF